MSTTTVYLAVLVAVAVIVGSNGKSIKSCPPNQVWTDCPSACPRGCEKSNSTACTANCDWPPRCVCREDLGFVKSGDDCVLKEFCPKTGEICPRNQGWTDCPSAVPRTCEEPNPTFVTLQCDVPARCVCREDLGYVKNGNDCVLKQDCPKTSK